MPKANVVSTTPGALPGVTPITLLPPLIDLGRALAAAELEYRRLDEDTEAATRASGQMDLLYKRETALRDLIATMAADTLADAAVQIGTAASLSSILESSDWSKPAEQPYLASLHGALYRIMVSALPVIATAANLDLATMCWDDVDEVRAKTFFGTERGS